MKKLLRYSPLLLLLFTVSCGTFQMQVITDPTTPTPDVPPAAVTPAFASPQQCSGFDFEQTLPADARDPRSYIGHHYNELNMPLGLEFRAGSVITDDLIWEWVSRPEFDMQFLSQINCRNEDGNPYTTVLDAVWIPRRNGRYERAGLCSPLPDDSPIIVFGRYNPNQPPVVLNGVQGWRMFNLDYGQRVNLQSMRFEPLPLEGLECIYIGGGPGS